jgi:hypothetical protein
MKGRSKKDERIATEVVFRVYSLPISVGVTGVCFPGVNQLMPGRVPVHSIVIMFCLYSYNILLGKSCITQRPRIFPGVALARIRRE